MHEPLSCDDMIKLVQVRGKPSGWEPSQWVEKAWQLEGGQEITSAEPSKPLSWRILHSMVYVMSLLASSGRRGP